MKHTKSSSLNNMRPQFKPKFPHPSADEIKAARVQAGLTQSQAATLCECAVATYQNWEQGRFKMPRSTFKLFLLLTKGE
jgi:DNA-binding transcriptional regulator YiaG